MLIEHGEILDRFRSHLEWARELDMATAWATSHEGLRLLVQRARSLRVRAVVGLWGNHTDPVALRILARIGKLRLVEGDRRFHPKVYIFRGYDKTVAWVGSANFTTGGFGMNEEAMFLTSATKSVEKWFNELWSDCGTLDDTAIDKYELLRSKKPPTPLNLEKSTRIERPMKLFRQVRDWDSYFAALEQCDRWWSKHRSWSVLGELRSWYETIAVLGDVVQQENWNDLSGYDRRRLLGLTGEEGWALLGRMRPSANDTVFKRSRPRVQRIVRRVKKAEETAFPSLAFEAYKDLRDIPGVGEGIATRLLSLARPDRFVSVNDGSREGLAEISDLPFSTLGSAKNYERLLKWLYSQRWYCESEPQGERERAIWRMRAALLDCFVYRN